MDTARFLWMGFIACLIQVNPLIARDGDDPLVVTLETDSSLAPLYLLPFISSQTDLSDDYIHQLEQVLAFDLGHNGSTSLAKRTAECDRLGQQNPSTS